MPIDSTSCLVVASWQLRASDTTWPYIADGAMRSANSWERSNAASDTAACCERDGNQIHAKAFRSQVRVSIRERMDAAKDPLGQVGCRLTSESELTPSGFGGECRSTAMEARPPLRSNRFGLGVDYGTRTSGPKKTLLRNTRFVPYQNARKFGFSAIRIARP